MDIKFLSEQTFLSDQTELSIRKIRYVMDHELVPNRTWFIDESAVGKARTFDEITTIFIACAAYLLDAGYKRESVRELITAISAPMPKNQRNPLRLPIIATAVKDTESAKLQFADGRYVRWVVTGNVGDWFVSRFETQSNLNPKIIIEIDIGQIRGRNRTTKGKRSRSVPLNPALQVVLRELERNPDGYVFHGAKGALLRAKRVLDIFKREIRNPLKTEFPAARGEISFAHGTIHSFRHFFVSEAFRQGATVAEIMDWVGHRSSQMVHHYRHLRPDDSQRRMQSINFISDDTVSPGNQPEPEVPRESQEG